MLGVGEFSYRFGLVSWVTQGLPYYIFAILFAIYFAKKVRNASLFTIPEKLEIVYGRKVSLIASVIIFLLVSPAPYLLMIGSLLALLFDVQLFYGLLIGLTLSAIYLFKGGFRANLWVDVLQFFVMFIGFIIIVVVAINNFGTTDYLIEKLPPLHLKPTGGFSPLFIIVWFLIALWTFADPGFHQRCYAAKSGSVAVKGIVISVVIWIFFDFLTTSTGLFSRAVLGEIDNPVLAYPLLAEEILTPGLKGLFYAALFATIFSTLNSFIFLSATTFSKDIAVKYFSKNINAVKYTQIGLVVSGGVAILLAILIPSVIEIWYTIGSLLIPSLIFLIIGSYYEKFSVSKKFAITEIITAFTVSSIWMFLRDSSIISGWVMKSNQ
ncbi:MAG: sodium:solute symporter family protein [Melioribacteraceae bacterium]|nr:sodium:solute symporter family protein [Melioribacteraceae bacterium]